MVWSQATIFFLATDGWLNWHLSMHLFPCLPLTSHIPGWWQHPKNAGDFWVIWFKGWDNKLVGVFFFPTILKNLRIKSGSSCSSQSFPGFQQKPLRNNNLESRTPPKNIAQPAMCERSVGGYEDRIHRFVACSVDAFPIFILNKTWSEDLRKVRMVGENGSTTTNHNNNNNNHNNNIFPKILLK